MQKLCIRALPESTPRQSYAEQLHIISQSNLRYGWHLSISEINCLTIFCQQQNEKMISSYLQQEKANVTMFHVRRSTSPSSVSHMSFTTSDAHNSRVNRAKIYDWLKSKSVVDSLLIFSLMPERTHAIEANITVLSSVIDPMLLYNQEINKLVIC